MREHFADEGTKVMGQILEELITAGSGERNKFLLEYMVSQEKWCGEPLSKERDMGKYLISIYQEVLDSTNVGLRDKLVVN